MCLKLGAVNRGGERPNGGMVQFAAGVSTARRHLGVDMNLRTVSGSRRTSPRGPAIRNADRFVLAPAVAVLLNFNLVLSETRRVGPTQAAEFHVNSGDVRFF